MTFSAPFKAATGSTPPVSQGAGQASLLNRPARRLPRLSPVARVVPVGADAAAALRDCWPGLMLAKFRSDEACAAHFGVTRQCATNWRSGLSGPAGGPVAQAALDWPGEFAGRMASALAAIAARGR